MKCFNIVLMTPLKKMVIEGTQTDLKNLTLR